MKEVIDIISTCTYTLGCFLVFIALIMQSKEIKIELYKEDNV